MSKKCVVHPDKVDMLPPAMLTCGKGASGDWQRVEGHNDDINDDNKAAIAANWVGN